MRTSEFYLGKYLKAANIEEPIRATIANLERHEMRDGTQKPVLIFNGDEEVQPVVLNKTNLRVLEDDLGTEFDNWIGRQIEISKASVQFQGKQVAGIAVKVLPKAVAKKRDDEIPF